MQKQYYVSQNYKIISRRENNVILLFPEIPYWIATTIQGEQFLNNLNGSMTIEEVTKKVLGEGQEKIAKEFLTPLIESQAVTKYGQKVYVEDLLGDAMIKPDKITILQTMRCNLRCKHCSVPQETTSNVLEELDLEQTKQALINATKIMGDNKELAFLGGEPLLRKDFISVAEFAKSIGFELGISTNGLLIDDEIARKAKELDIQVQISLDGPTKESHEFMRGSGTWDKTMDAIELLIKHNVRIQTNMVFHKGNIDLIEEYVSLGRRLQIKDLRLIPLMNMGRAKERLQFSSLEEMVDVIIELIRRDPEVIPYIRSTNFMSLVMNARITNRMVACGSGVITLILDPQGDIYPCLNTYKERYKICNVFDENFTDKFWNSSVRKQFRSLKIDQLNDKCATCDFRYICGGLCRGETEDVTSDLHAPYPYCESWKKSMIKIYWLLTEYPELGKEKAEDIVKGVKPFTTNC